MSICFALPDVSSPLICVIAAWLSTLRSYTPLALTPQRTPPPSWRARCWPASCRASPPPCHPPTARRRSQT
ncbi:hypothetical protein PF008_g12133 [Phytophthora fragariae]|uniref:Uncharacterized protein n=1 Tax=Phytophthora fragariae TaxID=53985 RepID=A0A6G0RNX2_9STRA|nr:hypothetical protein PF008_g12133 [Phytophthora fragariae]